MGFALVSFHAAPNLGKARGVGFTITTYNKAAKYPLPKDPTILGHGYGRRGSTPSSIVIHTTNNARKNTALVGERDFLLDSADVSAHYLIGKDGTIVQFLDPRAYLAWHVGVAISAYQNAFSIGIELHVSVGEIPTQVQKDATAWLCSVLMLQFNILPDHIDTHRAVARPVGRKSDPEGWSDADFYAWRGQPPIVPARRYRVKSCKVWQRPSLDGPLAADYPSGTPVQIDKIYANGAGHLANGDGFVNMRDLEEV